MFRQSHRGTIVWLLIVGLALALTLIAGSVPTLVGAALLAAYLLLVVAIARNVDVETLIEALPARREPEVEPSEVAREAMARARTHPRYDALIRLMDIGLIVDEPRPDGLSLRRGRFISLDDDGLRPFAIVNVPEPLANRVGRVRFELRDESGEPQYVYEADKWLQPGENAILPDYRLPIRRNKQGDLQPGAWSVHFEIDSGMLGVHGFSLTPSLAMRRRQMAADGELRERVWRGADEEDTSLPLSLEELLRAQSRQQHKG
ncbi:MAG: hypothetical protein GX613_07220 [Chloroflexi bacterium]|nr:hypothetical protein [Chloroflexota bacterium]